MPKRIYGVSGGFEIVSDGKPKALEARKGCAENLDGYRDEVHDTLTHCTATTSPGRQSPEA